MMSRKNCIIIGLVSIFTITCFSLIGLTDGQEYLPPKNGGSKKKKDDESSEPAKYSYSYEVQDGNENVDFAHMEKRDGDVTSGTYHVLLPDGRMQTVEYEAGPDGYNAKVTYDGEASFPASEAKEGKFDGYRYHAASARKSYIRKAPIGKLANLGKLAGAIVVQDNELNDDDEEDESET